MSKAFVLSNFGGSDSSLEPLISQPQQPNEDAFEAGYKAGWDDAVAKNSDEADKLTADLSENLQQIAFDYHQARTTIVDGVKATLTSVFQKVLPYVAKQGLAPLIKDILAEHIEKGTQAPFVLRINPNDRTAIDTILPEISGMEIEIQDNSDLGPGQVLFELGGQEHSLDVDLIVLEILTLTSEFFDGLTSTNQKEANHG